MEFPKQFSIFQCDECLTTLTCLKGLKLHIKKAHSPCNYVQCPYCPRVFVHPTNLDNHINNQCRPPLPSSAPPPIPPPPTHTLAEELIQEYGRPNIDGSLIEQGDDLEHILKVNHGAIRSYKRKGKVLSIANIEIPTDHANFQDIHHIPDMVKDAYDLLVDTPIKVNCSLGFILEHKTDGTFRYFHSSANNHSLFDSSRYVRNRDQFNEFVDEFCQLDLMTCPHKKRPNTAWRVHCITNISFYFYNLVNEGIA